ncbi:MAG TPA: hypothetical protein VFX58_05610 [Chitinophagaceae bacterium]|nr:hypothetical protein [Chitinophagaceae bacterium]
MKKIFFSVMATVVLAGFTACSDSKDRYVDLRTGKPVNLVKDDQSGLMVDESTKKPVYIYVDTKNNDTIYGKTGVVINGQVSTNSDGEYVYVNDLEPYEIKDGDYKKEVEKDGDIKIKDGDTKVKIDGETGEKKVKTDD